MASTHFVANLTAGLGTLTLKIYTRGTSTLINTGGDTASENGTRAGWYDWTVTEAVAGIQDCLITDSGGTIRAWLQTPPESADDTNTYVIEEIRGEQVDVRKYGGTAGTFTSGRPEVNTTHAAGTAWTSGAITAAVFAADAITAAKLAADVTTELQSGLATNALLLTVESKIDTIDGIADSILLDTAEIGAAGAGLTAVPWNAAWDAEAQSECADALTAYTAATAANVLAVETKVDTLLSRITSTLFTGITSLAEWLGLIAGKQTGNSTARTELQATGAGSGTFDETIHSAEAIRDRGDAAWVTATGFSTLDAAGVRTAVGLASANLDAQIGTLATADNLSTVAGYLDTEIAAILADTNELQADWADGGRLDVILDARASQTSVDAVAADLPQRITKNTALAAFSFAMFSSTDHATPATGLTVTAQRSIDGAAFANCANAASELSAGMYVIDLAASDLNGNVITLKFSAMGADTQFLTIATQPT